MRKVSCTPPGKKRKNTLQTKSITTVQHLLHWKVSSGVKTSHKITWWTRPDNSQVCGKCHPDPYAVALRKTTQSEPPPMPKGVRLLQWAPKGPPVAIGSWSVVTDVPQFIQTTLGQLQAAMAGENWLAGNWSVRELVDRLEQVGVKADVAAE
jgi:hypothetical protein